MKIKMLLSILSLCAFSIGPALYGQDKPDQKQPQQREEQADRPGMATFTGCLTEQGGTFMLATSTGEQVTATGSGLDKHKDHTVKLTGTTSEESGKKMLNVTKIEHVSPSCSK